MSQKKTKTRAAGRRQWRSSFFAASPVPARRKLETGTAAAPIPVAETRKSADAGERGEAGPRLLFTGHGIFEGTVMYQPGENALGTPQKRTSLVSLPAGTYRVLLDVPALTSPDAPSQPLCSASLRPLAPGVGPGPGAYGAGPYAGRFGGVITLTTPFQGEVEYGPAVGQGRPRNSRC